MKISATVILKPHDASITEWWQTLGEHRIVAAVVTRSINITVDIALHQLLPSHEHDRLSSVRYMPHAIRLRSKKNTYSPLDQMDRKVKEDDISCKLGSYTKFICEA